MKNEYILENHGHFMLRAIELAKKGTGYVSPNPKVGCVIVKDGRVIAEGFHRKFGGDHAEVDAIKNAIEDPLDATAYITLEPCTEHGKTPPCVSAIISAGIKEVFISSIDANPEVNGRGIDFLKSKGIKVHLGLLVFESKEINLGYSRWIESGLPYVIAKVAQSADGYIGADRNQQVWITGQESKAHTHMLRASVDAILVGRGTVEADNPQLTVREVNGVSPIRVILDSNRKLSLNINVFNNDQSDTIVFCSNKRFSDSETSFCKYYAVGEKGGVLDIKEVLLKLGSLGITSVLVEGGERMLKSFDELNYIDRFYLYTSKEKLENGLLKNPILIDSSWHEDQIDSLGSDKLHVFSKETECLQV